MQTEIKYPVIPEDPGKKFNLIWKNISFVVKKKTSQNYLKRFLGLDKFEYVRILNGVNGIVQSGTLMAIMGPSGSGKTTLLATLSRRIKGEIEGEILLNGKSISKEEMIKISGFVPQQDLAIESLTVQEHMEFMACMKMDRRYRAGLRKLRISVLLTELTLINCANSKLSALSGGEKKRVSLAVQLLTEPSILFCDEPTTGLDSYTAMTVLNTLHDVSKRGKIVICSIHQPTSGLFEIFHWLLLISAGRVAFQGSIIDATNFFDSLNLHCPQTYNNAEFYVSQLSENDEDKSSKKVKWICDRYKESIYAEKVSSSIRDYHGYVKEANNFPIIFSDNVLSKHDFKKIRTLTQIEWLLWRTYIDYKRNLSSIFLRFIIYLIPSTIIQPFLYAGIIYLITGLKGGLFGFIYFVIPIVSCAFTSSAFGLLMSTPFDSIDKASLISVPIDFIFLLFSGIFLHIGNLLPLISWMRYLSIFYYALEAVSLVQWGQYDHIECLPDPEIPCISTGLEVLDKYGYINDHYYIDLLGLLLIFLLSHFANFLVFRYRSQKEPVY
ncbi:protein scarlet-like isoform X2 [Vespula pensylvanica]|uniref:protein scarlet-like isoform X2 n=1 Tax=Vespula pensylvanica TaxID=30213 RepID=UPI001CBA598A|nr:protein scarlet-like isoform X2 [Vespula pensylvanica]